MQSPSTLSGVSFRQDPWAGQRKVFEALDDHGQYLNVQLPTGYGKTFTAYGCYSIKQHRGDVNRLLVIFPTDAQLDQFDKDSESDNSDFVLAGVQGPRTVIDLRYYGAHAIPKHRQNQAQIYAITVQSLIQARGADNVHRLMETGRWMVVIDEYHHYGIDKAWGKMARSLPAAFLLAMSATPWRPQDDSAFGTPHITVSYRDAATEGAVKKLRGHAYNYRIDTLTPDGNVRTYTTADLLQEAGTDSPEGLERWRIERKMRWSPKYVSPLVWYPIERMIRTRIETGCSHLQVLIGAMCVSHAELVCEQVRAMFDELRIDWVGTGEHGRSKDKNKEILDQFCPRKDAQGRRIPLLDVLVHVGMAAEGLDAIYVVEIVHLNRASRNNSNNQENGRAARLVKDAPTIPGNINFDTTSEYASFTGESIMDVMDGTVGTPAIPPTDPPEPRDFDPLPEDPAILIYDMELEHIDSGDPGVSRMAEVIVKQVQQYSRDDLDPKSPRHAALIDDAIGLYREMRRQEAEAQNSKAVIMQWSDRVGEALNAVTHRVIRMVVKPGQRPEKSLAGDIKRRINTRKKFAIGELRRDVEICRMHYRWLRNLEQELITAGALPAWLS